MPDTATKSYFDFLTQDLRKSGGVIDTDNISAIHMTLEMELIQRHSNGLVLDVGAGRPPGYFEHVINYEIVLYDSTDVMGSGKYYHSPTILSMPYSR